MNPDLLAPKPIIFTALSKKFFFARMLVCKFVAEKNCVPLNPFNAFGYFLYELVDRNIVRSCNNNLIRMVDEVWFFGDIADGVLFEIRYAISLGKKIKFFTLGSTFESIRETTIDELKFEDEITEDIDIIKKEISDYCQK